MIATKRRMPNPLTLEKACVDDDAEIFQHNID